MKKGYGGGMAMPGNMANMLKQAQRVQRQVEERQKEMEEKEFTGTAGGGAVKIVMNGKKVFKAVTIDPEVLDPEDVETLEELIVLAANEAMSQIDQESEEAYGSMTGGLTGFGGLGL